MGKNMKEFHKTTFKNICSAMMMLQEQNGAPVPQPVVILDGCAAGAIIPLVAEDAHFGMSGEMYV